MPKTETADSMARKPLKPAVVDVRSHGANDPRQDTPTVKPMPAPLETALGINQPWPKGLKRP